MKNEDSLATVLLVSRISSQGTRPLTASEYWKLRENVSQPSVLLGRTQNELVDDHHLSKELSIRIVALLDRGRAIAFNLEELEHSGVWTVTPFDDHYPQRLISLLDSKAPVLLHGAGPPEVLGQPGIGVVGSRDVSSEGVEAAKKVAARAVHLGFSVISGGARGVDQLAMTTAFQTGGSVVGILADSLLRRLRNPEVRRAIHDDLAVICTPYSPKDPFRVWKAMGRNKIIYALSEITVVIASEPGRGGTWSGASESLRGGFGRVGVWRGRGEGPGNGKLQRLGAHPIRSIDELEVVLHAERQDTEGLSGGNHSQAEQLCLFEKTA